MKEDNNEGALIKKGRPSKITEVDIELLCEFLEKGAPIPDACMRVGISPKTFRRWTLLGMEDEEQVFINFYYQTNRAMSKYKGKLIEIINDDAINNRSVSSAKWMLERYDPHNFHINSHKPEIAPDHMLEDFYIDIETRRLPEKQTEEDRKMSKFIAIEVWFDQEYCREHNFDPDAYTHEQKVEIAKKELGEEYQYDE